MAIVRKTINDIPTGMRNMYARAMDVLKKKNYDYAVELLKDLLQAVPGFWDARTAVREAEIARSRKLAGFPKIIAQIKSKIALTKGTMILPKDPREALDLAEESLACFYSVGGLKLVYEAAVKLESPAVAIDALEHWLDEEPDNFSLINDLIKQLELVNDVNRILQLRQKIAAARPHDLKAQSELRAAAAAASMANGIVEKQKAATAVKDNGTGMPDMSDLEAGDRIIRSEADIKEMIRRLKAVIDTGKGTADIYRKLAGLYQKVNMHQEAIDAYTTLTELQGSVDDMVAKAIEKSKVALLEGQLKELKESGAPQEEIEKLQKELYDYQLDRAMERVKAHPNDLQVRYELAVLLFEQGSYERSIEEFQEASKNAQKRLACMTYIARCYLGAENYEKAIEQFEAARKEMPYMDNQKMRATYYLAETLERIGKNDDALNCYKEIYEVNHTFMDVADKIQAAGGIPAEE